MASNFVITLAFCILHTFDLQRIQFIIYLLRVRKYWIYIVVKNIFDFWFDLFLHYLSQLFQILKYMTQWVNLIKHSLDSTFLRSTSRFSGAATGYWRNPMVQSWLGVRFCSVRRGWLSHPAVKVSRSIWRRGTNMYWAQNNCRLLEGSSRHSSSRPWSSS